MSAAESRTCWTLVATATISWAALSDAEFDRPEPRLELINLDRGDVLARPGQPIEYAYFPNSGMISIVALMSKASAPRSLPLATRA